MKKLLKALVILSVVTVMCVFAGSKTLQFTWEQTITSDFAGWKIYKATQTGGPYEHLIDVAYVSEQSEYTATHPITALDGETTTFYFVLTAFDTSGNESGYSDEASIPIDFQAPPVPITLTITVISQ